MTNTNIESSSFNPNSTSLQTCPAGHAAAKAWQMVNPNPDVFYAISPRDEVSIECARPKGYDDSFTVAVPTTRSMEFIDALKLDRRVTKVVFNGKTEFEAPKTDDLQKEFEAFKQKVAEVATRYAKEHDWCDVVDEALEELGLERKKSRVKVTLEFDYDAGELGGLELFDFVSLMDDWYRDHGHRDDFPGRPEFSAEMIED